MSYFVIGEDSLGTDTTILMAISSSYMADAADGKSLTLRVIIFIIARLGISGMVAGIIGGEWLKAAGYVGLCDCTFIFIPVFRYLTAPTGLSWHST